MYNESIRPVAAGCKDVFHAYLVENADYDGIDEIPCLKTSKKIPQGIITFSQALNSCDYDKWVAFYEHDVKFVRIWNNPRRYLEILKRFQGVISPDFSLYRNMPLCMQKWSTYQGRALAHWWQENGIEVIPNIRFADKRTYDFCFSGIERNSTVAVGTHGCIKKIEDRQEFISGLSEMVKRLTPTTIIVYGAAPESIFSQYRDMGIKIIQFESVFSQTHNNAMREAM